MEHVEVDFVIVGAGFAGLTAAWRIVDPKAGHKVNHSVIVLEARGDRVGGRVWTDTLKDGTWLDKGGTWFGPGQDYAYRLAEEMNVGTYPTYDKGDSLVVLEDGTILRKPESFPCKDLFDAAAGLLAMTEFSSMAEQIPLHAPWEAKQAAEWDRQTFAAWVESQFDTQALPLAAKALNTIMTGLFCIDTAELSLLDALTLVKSHGGIIKLMSVKGGNQQDRVVGGAQRIANCVAEKLGDRVRLGSPARHINQDATGVTVISDKVTVRAKRVIVAIPPTLAGHIQYSPQLPADRMQLMQRAPVGSVLKVVTLYDKPFWRRDDVNLTGQSFALTDPIGATFDGCTDEKAPRGVLISFAFGPHARAMGRLGKQARQGKVVEALVKRFGPEAGKPTLYEEVEWADEAWSQGGIFAHFPPGVLTNFGSVLRQPAGRIHWAGTETSFAFHGCINGAIESGERAAEEVLQAARGKS